jgi:hypothetical protein
LSPIVWEDLPPAPSSTRGKWRQVLEQLMERPGEWARIAEFDHVRKARSLAHNLNRRKVAVPPGRWEYASRDKRVYARYLGE